MIFWTKNFEKKDNWSLQFLPAWNGSVSFIEPNLPYPDVLCLFINTDTALEVSGSFPANWSEETCPRGVSTIYFSIVYLEMVSFYSPLRYKQSFLGKKDYCYTDDLRAVQAWDTRNSTLPSVLGSNTKITALIRSTASLKYVCRFGEVLYTIYVETFGGTAEMLVDNRILSSTCCVYHSALRKFCVFSSADRYEYILASQNECGVSSRLLRSWASSSFVKVKMAAIVDRHLSCGFYSPANQLA